MPAAVWEVTIGYRRCYADNTKHSALRLEARNPVRALIGQIHGFVYVQITWQIPLFLLPLQNFHTGG